MLDAVLLYGLIYPGAGAAVLAVLWLAGRGGVPPAVLRGVAVAGVVLSVVRLVFVIRSGSLGIDYKIFYDAGTDILHGVSPYTPGRYETHPILHLPTTYPVFALIAALPYRAGLLAWSVVNSVLAFAVVWQAWGVVDPSRAEGRAGLSREELWAVAAAFALSDACIATIQLGQLSLAVTSLILLALALQQRSRPAGAGVALGLSVMKVGTALPFFMFFPPRRTLWSWVAMAATLLLLLLLGGQAAGLPDELRGMLRNIGELAKPGAVNDITYQGPYCEWILGLDHLAYRLGLRGKPALWAVQMVPLAGVGALLAWQLHRGSLSRRRAVVLVSLFATIFLYHRLYDAVMVAPALVYAVDEAKRRRGRGRWPFVATVVLLLSLLYMRRKTMMGLTTWVVAHPGSLPARLVEVVVLPYGTWAVLVSMGLLWLTPPADGATAAEQGGPAPAHA